MEHLRWILLGAGILFVLVVYLISRRRSAAKDSYRAREEADVPSFSATDLDNVDEGVGQVRVIARIDEPLSAPADDFSEATARQAETMPDEPAPERRDDGGLITLTILPDGREQRFHGDEINSVLRSRGLVFGDMNIYHRLDLDGEPVFSVANMLKPGSFDASTMAELETTGLVVFMQAEMVDDPEAALDDMLGTAYRVAELLDGRLGNQRREPLGQQDTDDYRKRVADFCHAVE